MRALVGVTPHPAGKPGGVNESFGDCALSKGTGRLMTWHHHPKIGDYAVRFRRWCFGVCFWDLKYFAHPSGGGLTVTTRRTASSNSSDTLSGWSRFNFAFIDTRPFGGLCRE